MTRLSFRPTWCPTPCGETGCKSETLSGQRDAHVGSSNHTSKVGPHATVATHMLQMTVGLPDDTRPPHVRYNRCGAASCHHAADTILTCKRPRHFIARPVIALSYTNIRQAQGAPPREPSFAQAQRNIGRQTVNPRTPRHNIARKGDAKKMLPYSLGAVRLADTMHQMYWAQARHMHATCPGRPKQYISAGPGLEAKRLDACRITQLPPECARMPPCATNR